MNENKKIKEIDPNHNRNGYHTPIMFTKLMESREAHEKTQDELINMTADRDRWKRMFMKMYEDNAGVTDEMMHAYRATKNT